MHMVCHFPHPIPGGHCFFCEKGKTLFMKRDGATTSLWQDTVQNRPLTGATGDATGVDVLIVGGGITGVTTALLLQKAGMRCTIAEAHNLCFGTTGGTTAHINTFFDTSYDQMIKDFGEVDAQLVARAASEALALVKENITTYGIDCGHAEKDGYVYAQDDKQVKELDAMLDGALKAGVSVAYTDKIPVPMEFK